MRGQPQNRVSRQLEPPFPVKHRDSQQQSGRIFSSSLDIYFVFGKLILNPRNLIADGEASCCLSMISGKLILYYFVDFNINILIIIDTEIHRLGTEGMISKSSNSINMNLVRDSLAAGRKWSHL